MKHLSAIVVVVTLLAIPAQAVIAADGGKFIPPTFVITAVERNNYVRIKTDNFPANDTFKVTMGAMGTKGVGGILVATTKSGSGGSFEAKYSIPGALKNAYQIAIRLESKSSGYYAYNWFYNNDANTSGSSGSSGSSSSYSGYPYFYIAAVDEDTSVKITPHNFPPNDEFIVRMNWMHTKGIAGSIVDEAKTDANGNLQDLEYPIPDFLKGSYRIAIRLESKKSPYYAYNWFYNNDAP
jgi:hypothetical protein